jgi:magnesium chelatase subunit D
MEPLSPWQRVELALLALAVDPAGLKGLWLRARASPQRDLVTAALGRYAALPVVRANPTIGDDALFGGLDLGATLSSGRLVRSAGLLGKPALMVLAMAERCPAGLAARLAQALDGPGFALVALDEGAEPEEGLPATLTERLALFLDLDGLPWAEAGPIAFDPEVLTAARRALPKLRLTDKALEMLTATAVALGIDSLRAPILAAKVALALAAARGHATAEDDDLRHAAELTFAHRATRLPQDETTEPPPPEPEQDPEPPEPDTPPEEEQNPLDQIPDEILLEAVRAALPADLLAKLAAGRAAKSAQGSSGTGAARKGNRRGRPLPSMPGKLGAGARIDLVATLRAAAPWQPLRRAQKPAAEGFRLEVRPADIRVKRFQETSDRVLIFAVDASGSAALARLAEAKGAVELLLAQAYARRDHVALVAFRGTGAELILPPTRSLVQTKRRLAGLPGGGGTPLAAGLLQALELARKARAKGMTPTIALLTDGRSNIALDGSANREQAAADAQQVSAAIRALRLPALVIDTGNRPHPSLQDLATRLGAPYLPLPRADSQRLSAVLSAGLGD